MERRENIVVGPAKGLGGAAAAAAAEEERVTSEFEEERGRRKSRSKGGGVGLLEQDEKGVSFGQQGLSGNLEQLLRLFALPLSKAARCDEA